MEDTSLSNTYYTNVEQRGKFIYLRYVLDGEKKSLKIPCKPTLYIPAGEGQEPIMWGLKKEPLTPVKFETPKEAKDFIETYKTVDNFNVYGIDNFASAFVCKNFGHKFEHKSDILKIANYDIEIFSGYRDEQGNPVSIPFEKMPIIIDKAELPITAITLHNSADDIYHVWGLHESEDVSYTDPKKTGQTVKYHEFYDEVEMLKHYLLYWESQSFDIVTGFNIDGFDNPYVVRRVKKLFGDDAKKWFSKLSPWGIVTESKKKDKWNNEMWVVKFIGIDSLDFMKLYQKFTFHPMTNYKLATIGEYEINEKKLDYSEARNLNILFLTNFQKYIDYNIQDVALVNRLIKHTGLLDLAITLAYTTKSNYSDVFGTIKPVANLLYSRLYNQKKVPLIKSVYKGDISFVGGYVKEPVPGLYKYLLSADLNSLYPHCWSQQNLGPETIIEDNEMSNELLNWLLTIRNDPNKIENCINKKYDTSILDGYPGIGLSVNGYLWKTEESSILRDFKDDLYGVRSKAKKHMIIEKQKLEKLHELMKTLANPDIEIKESVLKSLISLLNNTQLSQKTVLNASYGALSNRYMKDFFDIRIAEAITTLGQTVNRTCANKLNEFLNDYLETKDKDFVITMDTDSFYFDAEMVVYKFGWENLDDQTIANNLDQWYKDNLTDRITKWMHEIKDYLHSKDNQMFYAREKIAKSGIFVAKKRYALAVIDDEGVRYKSPKIKVIGLESVRSTFPAWSKKYLKECYSIALLEDETRLHAAVKEIKAVFDKMPIDDIALNVKLGDLNKYECARGFIKGTPSQYKAALVFNRKVIQLGLDYPLIESGDAVKIILLEPMNQFFNDRLAFVDHIPEEFEIEKCIDRETVWEKSFITPLQAFLDAIGWKYKKINTLFAFFGKKG